VGDERSPSVISTNAIVAGLMELRMMALALGTTPDATVGTQRYFPSEGTLHWAVTKECAEDCSKNDAIAKGDQYDLPLGHDYDAEHARSA
jgi:hypothetical protein